jgi:CheY-like chemotaxis protein
MKIIVADDSAEMRRLIRSILPPGIEVIECEDGMAAVHAVRQHAPDWVLLDIAMTPLDGLSAAAHLRKIAPNTQIIFVTAHNEPRWRLAAERLRVSGYVLKDELEQISQILGRSHPA